MYIILSQIYKDQFEKYQLLTFNDCDIILAFNF